MLDKNIDDYKAVIINGPSDKSDDMDGKVDFVGLVSEWDFHIDCLVDYAVRKYPDVPIFQKMDNCEPNVPIFFLTLRNNVVYINISGGRVGKYGMLFLPDEISAKQKEVLYEFARKISNAHVDIVYDMDFDDGFVESKELNYKVGQPFEKQLESFFKENNKQKNKE